MRTIRDVVFLGNCHPTSTEDRLLALHRRLEEAVMIMGGIQQDPDYCSGDRVAFGKADTFEVDADKADLRDAVADIACAFGFSLAPQISKVQTVKALRQLGPTKQKVRIEDDAFAGPQKAEKVKGHRPLGPAKTKTVLEHGGHDTGPVKTRPFEGSPARHAKVLVEASEERFGLNEVERKRAEEFRALHKKGTFRYVFTPTQLGTAVEIVNEVVDSKGKKKMTKKDITDHDSW